jgi:hypothetical protein
MGKGAGRQWLIRYVDRSDFNRNGCVISWVCEARRSDVPRVGERGVYLRSCRPISVMIEERASPALHVKIPSPIECAQFTHWS